MGDRRAKQDNSYNSVIYETQPTMLYQAYVITPNFFTGAKPNASKARETFKKRQDQTVYALSQGSHPKMKEMSLAGFSEGFDYCQTDNCEYIRDWVTDKSTLRLSAVDCLYTYARTFTGNRSEVVMISSYDMLSNTSISNNSNPLLYTRVAGIVDNTGFASPPWLCGNTNIFDCE